ncbi:MAG TPA: hypothetical protein VD969_20525 [Symbiobacteriaceae bacterium]|nr:hypothetical protein [Symbiobacteriaceae bacterium]
MAWGKESTRTRPVQRRSVRPGALAALLLGACALYAAANARYDAYDLGYSVQATRATVQTWRVRLPFGYELAWWKSDPPGPQDGLRLFGRP